jgi:tight adherence protein B
VTAALLCAAAALAAWPAGSGARGRLVARRRPEGAGSLRFLSSPPAAGAVALLVGAVLSTPLVAGLAGCCAALAGCALLRRRRAAAEEDGLLSLAEALGVFAAELDAGRPLPAAARAAVRACPDGDLAAALAGALGAEAEARAGPAGLERVRAAIRLSSRTGCSLSAVVRALEDDLRARHRQVLDLRTATAGPRASAVVLAGLPVLGLLMGSGIGARPWAVLTTTTAGQVLLVAGVALEVAGIAWTGRLSARAVRDPVTAASGHGR